MSLAPPADRSTGVYSVAELENIIGYTLPLKPAAAPFIRHTATGPGLVERLLTSHNEQAHLSPEFLQKTSSAWSASSTVDSCGIPRCWSHCSHPAYTRFERESEWDSSLAQDEADFERMAKATGVKPMQGDAVCEWRLLNWAHEHLKVHRPLPPPSVLPMPSSATTTPFVSPPLSNSSFSPSSHNFAPSVGSDGKFPPFSPSHQVANVLLNLDRELSSAAGGGTSTPPARKAAAGASSHMVASNGKTEVSPMSQLARTASDKGKRIGLTAGMTVESGKLKKAPRLGERSPPRVARLPAAAHVI